MIFSSFSPNITKHKIKTQNVSTLSPKNSIKNNSELKVEAHTYKIYIYTTHQYCLTIDPLNPPCFGIRSRNCNIRLHPLYKINQINITKNVVSQRPNEPLIDTPDSEGNCFYSFTFLYICN